MARSFTSQPERPRAWRPSVSVHDRTTAGARSLPHSVPFTLLGAGLLWFGWFGFNGGSAQAANAQAVLAFVNTLLAPSGALVAWTLLDLIRTGRATAVGVATAIVVGLVAITPGAGFVSPLSAIAIGAAAVVPSYYALVWRVRTRLDDALDVGAAHGLGGISGALLTGLLAQRAWGSHYRPDSCSATRRRSASSSWPYLVAGGYSALLTFGIVRAMDAITEMRAAPEDEAIGLDVSEHGEEAYAREDGAILILSPKASPQRVAAFTPSLTSQGETR